MSGPRASGAIREKRNAVALPYELLAIDLDGTLLDRRGQVSAENRAALHAAHAAGLKIVLCTGRSFTETRPILDQIGLDLDATVTVGGALITDVATGRTIERREIDAALAAESLAWFRARRKTVLWLTDRDAAGYDGHCLWHEQRHPAIGRWLEKSGCSMRLSDTIPEQMPAALRITIVDEPAALEQIALPFREAFGERFSFNVINVPLYEFSVLETFAGDVTKWTGVQRLCRRWNIDPARTATIGDDVNDVSMIQHAGLGAAVGNAIEAVKKIAKLTVRSHDEHGVAEFVRHLLCAPRSTSTRRVAESPTE